MEFSHQQGQQGRTSSNKTSIRVTYNKVLTSDLKVTGFTRRRPINFRKEKRLNLIQLDRTCHAIFEIETEVTLRVSNANT